MLKIDVTLPIEYASCDIKEAICSRLPLARDEIIDAQLVRRVLDLSDTTAPMYKCTVAFSTSEERERGLLKMRNKVKPHTNAVYTAPNASWDFRPVVVGAGPAGIFAALILAESGARPVLLERGLSVDERKRKVELYNTLGILDTECNVQFGEGGAGTFSDGKLKVGARDPYKLKVISELIASGACEDIAFSATAHLGTDKLGDIMKSLRRRIESLGGELIFGAKMTSLGIKGGELATVSYEKDGEEYSLDTRAAIIAIGHSARDTVKWLYSAGLKMEQRAFGVGMRIEHPREYINGIVYREAAPLINETASYHLVTHLPGGRSVYSFCMCPGGTVVAASSDREGIVTNGMSEYSRMAENSNAAILVSVTPEDFPSDHPLSGMDYQLAIERRAYELSRSHKAPSVRLDELLSGRLDGGYGEVLPSYPCGTYKAFPDSYLPDYVVDSIRLGMRDFDDWMPGFAYPDAVLTGPETRSTSPVRMTRTDSGEAIGYRGIFPAGEGAGYAGGIVSSATDGIRQAEKLICAFAQTER